MEVAYLKEVSLIHANTEKVLFMVSKGHYVHNEQGYKDLAYAALEAQFPDRPAFDYFYNSLNSSHKKNEFLRVSSFYLYLVKRGDWHVEVQGSSEVVDYLTNSFKLVALFSLIESLTDLSHQDFFQWLVSQDAADIFPIADENVLHNLYQEYKKTYGSIRRCVAFFDRLPQERKQSLVSSIHVGGAPLKSIRKLAEHLYELRSKFVHEAVLVLSLGRGTVLSLGKKGKLVRTNLPVPVLLEAFEEGLLVYFGHGT